MNKIQFIPINLKSVPTPKSLLSFEACTIIAPAGIRNFGKWHTIEVEEWNSTCVVRTWGMKSELVWFITANEKIVKLTHLCLVSITYSNSKHIRRLKIHAKQCQLWFMQCKNTISNWYIINQHTLKSPEFTPLSGRTIDIAGGIISLSGGLKLKTREPFADSCSSWCDLISISSLGTYRLTLLWIHFSVTGEMLFFLQVWSLYPFSWMASAVVTRCDTDLPNR